MGNKLEEWVWLTYKRKGKRIMWWNGMGKKDVAKSLQLNHPFFSDNKTEQTLSTSSACPRWENTPTMKYE